MLSGLEKQLGVVKDALLPADANFRYDVYFTDRRVAIVCMGKTSHFESDMTSQFPSWPSTFGIQPTTSSFIEKPKNKQAIDREVENWSLDDLLGLSKKSCVYTLDEIEEVKVAAGEKPKLLILSKECESKFALTEPQLEVLAKILPRIEALKNKFWISGKWNKIRYLMKENMDKP